MSSTLREMQVVFASIIGERRFWIMLATMIGLFGVVGPFGTFEDLNLPMRLLYWGLTMVGSWLIAISFVSAAIALTEKRPGFPLLTTIIASLVASPLMAVWNYANIRWFIEQTPDSMNFWILLAYTIPITVFFVLLFYAVFHDRFDTKSQVNQSLLMKRLPVEKRGPVKHLSMQDHYIAVTTTRGHEMVLMRMSDAIAELEPDHGLQIHRSHWVNPQFVERVERRNGQPIVVMDDGAALPVSRTYTKAAREAGLF